MNYEIIDKDLNIEIRSKNTYQKGRIINITNDRVIVTFVKEKEPIAITFDTFLKNCMCDEKTRRTIEKKIEADINECKKI